MTGSYQRKVEMAYVNQALLLAEGTLKDCREKLEAFLMDIDRLEKENEQLRIKNAELVRSNAPPISKLRPKRIGGLSID